MKTKTFDIREVDENNYKEIVHLQVDATQKNYIEKNATSLLEAAYEKEYQWRVFALYYNHTLVGFTMIGAYDALKKSVWLDRFMIDHKFQHQGLGSAFLKRLLHFIPTQFSPLHTIYLSYHKPNQQAKQLYSKHGFKDTGSIDPLFEEYIMYYTVKKKEKKEG